MILLEINFYVNVRYVEGQAYYLNTHKTLHPNLIKPF